MRRLEHLHNAKDHFGLFGLEPSFDVDESALQSKYLELTRLTHPDFAGADIEAQVKASQLSARINEAYRVLDNPESRANYLLEQLGGPSKHEDRSLPPGFLEQVMVLREDLSEAQAEHDGAAMAAIEARARDQRRAHLQKLGEMFRQLAGTEAEDARQGTRQAIRTELNALRYIERLLEQAHPERI